MKVLSSFLIFISGCRWRIWRRRRRRGRGKTCCSWFFFVLNFHLLLSKFFFAHLWTLSSFSPCFKDKHPSFVLKVKGVALYRGTWLRSPADVRGNDGKRERGKKHCFHRRFEPRTYLCVHRPVTIWANTPALIWWSRWWGIFGFIEYKF